MIRRAIDGSRAIDKNKARNRDRDCYDEKCSSKQRDQRKLH